MTMEIDALYAGLPMRNSLDPCNTCAEWQAQAERVRVLREALQLIHGQTGDEYAHDIFEARAIAGAALEATK